MRIWGGLPTTGPAAPPSSPGRHRAARTRPPRADHAAPSRPGARPQAAPATRGRARRACRAARGLPQQARAGSRGALRADVGYLAAQLARAAPGGHIAFAVGARPIAPPGRLPDGAARTTGARRPAPTPPGPPWRITGQAGARRMRRCCSAGPGRPC